MQSSTVPQSQEKPTKRRRHKNSKLGCPNCKRRRVKCSEDLPQCHNCVKHKVRCGYLDYTAGQLDEMRAAKSGSVGGGETKSEVGDIDLKTLSLSRQGSHTSYNSFKVSPKSDPGLQSRSPEPVPTERERTDESKPSSNSASSKSTGNSGASHSLFAPSSALSGPSKSSSRQYSDTHTEAAMGEDVETLRVLEGDYTQHRGQQKSSQAHTGDGHYINPNQFNPIHHHKPHHAAMSLDPVVNDVLNFQAQHVTQDFDNLVSSDTFDIPIIYPVYSIQNSAAMSRVLSAMGASGHDVPNSPAPFVPGSMESSNMPYAQARHTRFAVLKRPRVDYGAALFAAVARLGPSIASGTCPLPDIRCLFLLWLNYFIAMSMYSNVMFSCLLNLTTNYLISNCFSPHLRPVDDFSHYVDLTRLNNRLIIISIKYYARTIKQLRHFLNTNLGPDTCSYVSYILSLMSIYDPEATLNSINCFRDGLFSVLSYNINQASRNFSTTPSLIPTHLQLMVNIERSVYHPDYHPAFLHEFREVLGRFGVILRALTATANQSGLAKRLNYSYDELQTLTSGVVDHVVGEIAGSYDDIDHQQEVLFRVMQKWAIIYPIRFLVGNSKSDPAEKILALFYKAFKKALYSIFPQVKYFFLRDFDSPLMLDVVITRSDYEIFASEISLPATLEWDSDVYASYKQELELMSAYLIRLATFMQKRAMIIYRMTVLETSKQMFPITDVRKWRLLVTNIATVRRDFATALGLVEEPVVSFSSTVLKPQHYPRRGKHETEEVVQAKVDFSTLQANCLLQADHDPFLVG